MDDSICISLLSSSARALFESFEGDESGDAPFFRDEPLDNLSPVVFSKFPVIPKKNPFIPALLFMDETPPDLDVAIALSSTKRRCWSMAFE